MANEDKKTGMIRLDTILFRRDSSAGAKASPHVMYIDRCTETVIGRALRCNFSQAAPDRVDVEQVIGGIVSSFSALDLRDKRGLERLIFVLKRGLQNAEDFLAELERREAQDRAAMQRLRDDFIQGFRLTTPNASDMSDAEILDAAEALIAKLRKV